jgi:hypothetical protein
LSLRLSELAKERDALTGQIEQMRGQLQQAPQLWQQLFSEIERKEKDPQTWLS